MAGVMITNKITVIVFLQEKINAIIFVTLS